MKSLLFHCQLFSEEKKKEFINFRHTHKCTRNGRSCINDPLLYISTLQLINTFTKTYREPVISPSDISTCPSTQPANQVTNQSCDVCLVSDPCIQTDVTPFRYLGDKFSLDGAECVCTQDRNINNRVNSNPASKFNTPSLCGESGGCLLYTSPSPRDRGISRMPSSA